MAFKTVYSKKEDAIIYEGNRCRLLFYIDYKWVKKHRVEFYFKKELRIPVYKRRREKSGYSPDHKAIFVKMKFTHHTRHFKIETLLHELRHFMQDQIMIDFHKDYLAERAKYGYWENIYEQDAMRWARKYNRFNHMTITKTDKRGVNYFMDFYKKFSTYYLIKIYQEYKNRKNMNEAYKKNRQLILIALYNILKKELKDDFKEMVLDQQMYFGSIKLEEENEIL